MTAPAVVDLNQFVPRTVIQCGVCGDRIPEPPLVVSERDQRDAALTGSLGDWIDHITTAALGRQARLMNAAVALHLQQHTTESEG